MRVVLLVIAGFMLGAICGGLAGVAAGLVWTHVFETSGFEGYSGMLVFYSFMPVGALIGALAGAIWLGAIGARR